MKLYRNLDVNLWVTNISNSVPSLLCPNDDSPSFIPFTESAVARGNLWSFADMKQSMTGDTQARETVGKWVSKSKGNTSSSLNYRFLSISYRSLITTQWWRYFTCQIWPKRAHVLFNYWTGCGSQVWQSRRGCFNLTKSDLFTEAQSTF